MKKIYKLFFQLYLQGYGFQLIEIRYWLKLYYLTCIIGSYGEDTKII